MLLNFQMVYDYNCVIIEYLLLLQTIHLRKGESQYYFKYVSSLLKRYVH